MALPILMAGNANKITKVLLPVVGIGLLGFIAYLGYEYLNRDKLPPLVTNPNFPPSTLSDVQANAIAERLYAAMKDVGTDEEAIMSALQNLTENDFIKVYEAFGKRQYSLAWGNVGDPITSGDHHLITWLTNELNTKEIEEIQKIIPNILNVAA